MFELRPFNRSNSAVYDPFRELEKNFFNNFFKEQRSSLTEFKTDIQDKGDNFLIESDLPGFNKEDIHIDINGDLLTISAERRSSFEDSDSQKGYIRCERSYGAFSRSFDVSDVNTDGIKAEYTDGVLKLTMPKKQPATPESRRLEIE